MNNIIINTKCNWLILFANILLSAGGLAMLCFFAYVIIEEPDEFCEFWYTVLILLICLFKSIDNICWNICGKEIIEIDKENLTIKRKGKIFSSKIIIQLSEIEAIEAKQYKASLLDFYFMILKGYVRRGNLMIYYLGRYIYVGQGLSINNAEEIKHKLELIKPLMPINKINPQR